MLEKEGPNKGISPHYLEKELYELVQSDELVFHFLHSGLLDGIWYWDLEKPENEWMSADFWRVLGYEASEKKHLVSEWQDIIFADDLAIATLNFKMHLADPTHPYDQYVRYIHKQGYTIWVRCRGFAIHDKEGKPVRFLGAHVDVTTLMDKQEELLKEKIRLEHLVRQLQEDNAMTDLYKQETNVLKAKIEHSARVEQDTELLKPHVFWEESKKLHCIAKRAGINVAALTVRISNANSISNTFGDNELASVKRTIVYILRDAYPDCLSTALLSNEISTLICGVTNEESPKLKHQVQKDITNYSWGVAKPDVTIASTFETAKNDTEQVKRLVVSSAQSLSEK